jgi:hypothetical protein
MLNVGNECVFSPFYTSEVFVGKVINVDVSFNGIVTYDVTPLFKIIDNKKVAIKRKKNDNSFLIIKNSELIK